MKKVKYTLFSLQSLTGPVKAEKSNRLIPMRTALKFSHILRNTASYEKQHAEAVELIQERFMDSTEITEGPAAGRLMFRIKEGFETQHQQAVKALDEYEVELELPEFKMSELGQDSNGSKPNKFKLSFELIEALFPLITDAPKDLKQKKDKDLKLVDLIPELPKTDKQS